MVGLLVIISTPVAAQHHYSDWVYRYMMDTTIVRCWNDSLSDVSFPPNCMGMGMMYPDSLYCRIDRMPMDSLHQPFDSTFLGWHRMRIGSDSTHFNYMDCDSGYGSNYMMQFARDLRCALYWDSLATDSLHRHWRPTGVMGWNGSGWVALPNVSFNGNEATVTTSQVYAALAIVGGPETALSVGDEDGIASQFELQQNYPNPFNPSATITFSIPQRSSVTLSVYNLLGQLVATLVDGERQPGSYSVLWDAGSLPSGMYFYRIEAGRYVETKKMVLLR